MRNVAANLFAHDGVTKAAREILAHSFERFSAAPLQLAELSARVNAFVNQGPHRDQNRLAVGAGGRIGILVGVNRNAALARVGDQSRGGEPAPPEARAFGLEM